MPPPTVGRRPFYRTQSATPALNGRASPADSVASIGTNASRIRSSPPSQITGSKRKERDFEHDAGGETNINVVVRCRGRNDREVRENSGVVVSTSGIKGNIVDLAMGPSALSNKTYQFDKVFSPAADQIMVFDEVVAPIIEEVLSGFNCTIFAYGQTGTGKTYTMSGDISHNLLLPDEAGIIPRALHALFGKLDGDECENSVKCSFIELYNEELRDLLSADDKVKLKLYEDNNNKKGHSATMVQGMEESHIASAAKGIQLLREGSHKRQVAATKCNDLSSRSHTVFTVTVYMKRTTDAGEEYLSAGKLNLVDLAGSENIQRSGAENKRATEAGLINKSLLTLGRVINALVDRASHVDRVSHIPYRESKLTRLLQDSLGGRTKTCIIATLSPARSNLEETISTLDYAFRAKNIRNKPQISQMISKKTLLREFTVEIEKLKSELIANRQRNGVYLTQETYEGLTTESESRRILSEEQRDKIETIEINLRNKVQELFSLTANFNSLKKDNEMTRMMLDGTKSILEKTEAVLEHTRNNLAEEMMLRKHHEKTEEDLTRVGQNLISTLDSTTVEIGSLHSKLRRRSDLQSLNRRNWTSAQSLVTDTTSLVEDRLADFQNRQDELFANLSQRMKTFVEDELGNLKASQEVLKEESGVFEKSHAEMNEQTAASRDNINKVLEEIQVLRQDVKEKVRAGLDDLSAVAQRISDGIITEINSFHTQLQSSYHSLGRDFKGTFDDLVRDINEQKSGAEQLRQQIVEANNQLAAQNGASNVRLSTLLEEERKIQTVERQALLSQITALMTSTAERQEQRVEKGIASIRTEFDTHAAAYDKSQESYSSGEREWSQQSEEMVNRVIRSRDNVKMQLQTDFSTVNRHTTSLRTITTAVHSSTLKTVQEQMQHLDAQLHGLDDIEARIKEQNNTHHAAHVSSLSNLAKHVQSSFDSIGDHFSTSFSRVSELDRDMAAQTTYLKDTLPTLAEDGDIRRPLHELRETVESQPLEEYQATGETPQRKAFEFPVSLPRTEPHDTLLSKFRRREGSSPIKSPPHRSPQKGLVFADSSADPMPCLPRPTSAFTNSAFSVSSSNSMRPSTSSSMTSNLSLRELDVNILSSAGASGDDGLETSMPPLKRQNTTGAEGVLPMKKRSTRMTVAGVIPTVAGVKEQENAALNQSVGPGSGLGSRRRLLRSNVSS